PSDETGQDRQAGRVGTRPAVRPKGVRGEVPDGARSAGPATRPVDRIEDLVEVAALGVPQEQVTIAADLDLRARWDGIWAGIGLIGVVERHVGGRRREIDLVERDAITETAVPGERAEV